MWRLDFRGSKLEKVGGAHVGIVIYPVTLCNLFDGTQVKCVVTITDSVEVIHGASEVQMVQIQGHDVMHFVESS